ncbi:MAG TPA: urease accessory protein UreD [Salinarimonas sp.]|nr:urease accessory protein UreD [Salinarimonas sp.]
MLMTSPSLSPAPLPAFVRARGGVRVAVERTPRGSAAMRVAERGGYRVRFPRSVLGCEGVLINTGGGMTGGDRLDLDVAVGEGAAATLTTQAAEKIYRARGADVEIAIRLDLAPGSRLDWLPQESILFDRARLARRLDVAMAPDAALTLVECAVFGRTAMGEAVTEGSFRDRWRVRRGGRLVLAEDLRLEGDVAALLARPAVGAGARAMATLLHVAPDAEARLESLREALAGAASECGASAWNGLLLARFLHRDAAALRADLARVLQTFRGAPLPRSWQT